MKLSEEEIDDLLYFARIGDYDEFESLGKELCVRENIQIIELLQAARDVNSGNEVLHMAAANGHCGRVASIQNNYTIVISNFFFSHLNVET